MGESGSSPQFVAGIALRNSLRDSLPGHGIISDISRGYDGGGGVGKSLDPYTGGEAINREASRCRLER